MYVRFGSLITWGSVMKSEALGSALLAEQMPFMASETGLPFCRSASCASTARGERSVTPTTSRPAKRFRRGVKPGVAMIAATSRQRAVSAST